MLDWRDGTDHTQRCPQSLAARKAYPSDLRDGEWAVLEARVPAVKSGGRPARHSRREIVNAILSVVRGGNQWRAMPHDLPPWQTAYYYFYFRNWRNDGTWGAIHPAAVAAMAAVAAVAPAGIAGMAAVPAALPPAPPLWAPMRAPVLTTRTA